MKARGKFLKRYTSIVVSGLMVLMVLAAGCSQSGESSESSGSGEAGRETTVSETRAGQTIATAGGSYTRVEPETLRQIVEEQDQLVVNTHVPYEGELPATDRFIPYDQIANSSKLPEDKSAAIVVYCKSGPMSEQASETLVEQGYTGVVDLEGGMDAWESADLPLENTR